MPIEDDKDLDPKMDVYRFLDSDEVSALLII